MLHRRDAMLGLGRLGIASAGASAMSLPGLLRAEGAMDSRRTPGKAKSCILVYLWGGPPQQDMFDLKPDAPEGIRSLFDPIDTVTPGIRVSDQLPQIARHTDKMSLVRSVTHGSNVHEVGVYHTLTGKVNPRLAVPRNKRNRGDFPCAGSIASYFADESRRHGGNARRDMPASVTIPRPIGHDGVVYSGTYAGFLGPRYDPIELQPPAEVNEAAPHSFDLPKELADTRFTARVGLLRQIESADRALQASRATRGLDSSREMAFRMLSSPRAKSAFDVEREDPRLRDRYGRNEYGEAFLLARRLVESGVRLVTITWYYVCPNGNVANVWDNHGGTGSLGGITGYQMLKEKYCLPPLDRGYSALLDDLSQRGLLDETLVAMFGEFGRTPKINKNAGRDHWGASQTAVFAGGGIRGGTVYGSSDRHAAYPASHPVGPEDVLATMYYALGIPPDAEVPDPTGRPHRVTDGKPMIGLF